MNLTCPQCQKILSKSNYYYLCDNNIHADNYKDQHIFYYKNYNEFSLYSRKDKDMLYVGNFLSKYSFRIYNDIPWWIAVSSYWKFLNINIEIPPFLASDSYQIIKTKYQRIINLKSFL